MRYAIIFAATAAASEAYGYNSYDDAKSSSTVVYPSSKGGNGGYGDASTNVYGYATMTPGYGKPAVTITSQYQAYPTCVSKDGDKCGKWNDEKYISTVIKDYDNKDVTVTKTEQVVTIYKTKSTKTNSATPTPTSYKKDDFMKVDCKSSAEYSGYSADYKTACDKSVEYNDFPADCKTSAEYNGYATDYKSTCDKALEYKEWCKTNSGSSDDKSTEWYELYEKSYEASYKDLGPHAMVGYPGSGLRGDLKDHQPIKVKEYKDGKWSEYEDDLEYGTPEDVKTYEKAGVYTNPSKDVYVDHPITKGSEAYATAKAGTPVTFGGSYTDVAAPCTVTGAYAAYETGVSDGKTITSTVVKYVTVYCPKAGKCEVAKPTTTVYEHDTEFAYPTPVTYAPGVYHYDAETVTITDPSKPYTCEYKQTKTYDHPKETPAYSSSADYHSMSSKTGDYPSYATSTPVYDDKHSASSYPSVSTKTDKYDDPSYPSATPSHDEYPTYDNKGDEYSTGNKTDEHKGDDEHKDEETPVEEEPVEEEPKDETPVEEEPKDETPVEEEHKDETPVEPTPVEPTPVEPTPVEPTPVEPTPVEPTPVEPTPIEPTPVEPTPIEPTPIDEAAPTDDAAPADEENTTPDSVAPTRRFAGSFAARARRAL